MQSIRVAVPAGQIVDVGSQIRDSGAYGSTIMLYNLGDVALELGGDDLDATNGWRGFVPGSVVSADISPDEGCRVRNPGVTTAGAVDVLVIR